MGDYLFSIMYYFLSEYYKKIIHVPGNIWGRNRGSVIALSLSFRRICPFPNKKPLISGANCRRFFRGVFLIIKIKYFINLLPHQKKD
jgi:hypothetical protein